MADEVTETIESTEGETTETVPPTALETLVTEASEKVEANKSSRDLDYIDDGDDFESTTVAPEGEETIESLKARLQEEKTMRLRAENRSSARNLREKMKEEFPNANPDTVDKYLRLVASGRKSSESVRAIFGASNGDFSRGEEASDLKWKARFEELQKTASAEAEQVVQEAWGTPATNSPISGGDSITHDQFKEALKTPGLTEQQLQQLEKRVKY